MHYQPPTKEFVVKPCTHTALARAYGLSRKMLYKKLKPHAAVIGPRQGYKYNLEQLFQIFGCIGWPPHPIPAYGE
jgi:hypothetical protein